MLLFWFFFCLAMFCEVKKKKKGATTPNLQIFIVKDNGGRIWISNPALRLQQWHLYVLKGFSSRGPSPILHPPSEQGQPISDSF